MAKIFDDDWMNAMMVSELLELAAPVIEMSSSIENATLSFHTA